MAAIETCPYCGQGVSPGDAVCANCFWDLSQASAPPRGTMMTMAQQGQSPVVEIEDDFAPAPPTPRPAEKPKSPTVKASGFQKPTKSNSAPVKKPQENPTPIGGAALDADTALPFRPRLRRPTPILRIYDDDGKDCEAIRIRGLETIIGRDEGEVKIPNDRMMSGKHAALSCKVIDGNYRWFLIDLDSTNGTFLQVQSGKLRPNAEFIAGSFRYRLVIIQQGEVEKAEGEAPISEPPLRTLGWKSVSASDVVRAEASLVRITPGGPGAPVPLSGIDNIIGSDPQLATVAIDDDPMLSSRHLRIYQDEFRRWYVEDLDSRNGVWLAIKEQEIDKSAKFQMGEQRFGIRFP